jgi:malonate transporter
VAADREAVDQPAVPGFLIPAIWGADLSGGSAGAAAASAVVAVLIVSACTLLAKPLMKIDGPAYTSVFQGVIRWNSFVFLPVIQAVVRGEGLALAAVMIACIIPVTNIGCVAVLARWGADQRGSRLWPWLKAMLANPILLACLIGLALNLLKVPASRGFRHAGAAGRGGPAAGPDRGRGGPELRRGGAAQMDRGRDLSSSWS